MGEGEGVGAPEPRGRCQDGELPGRQRGRHLTGAPDDPRPDNSRGEQFGVLIDREDGHPVGSISRKSYLRIDTPHGVREWAAARDHQYRIPARGRGGEHGYYYIKRALAAQ